jgi:hypothetical protein
MRAYHRIVPLHEQVVIHFMDPLVPETKNCVLEILTTTIADIIMLLPSSSTKYPR